MSDKRLGKGLGAIFGDDITEALEEIQQGAQDNHNTNVLNIALSEIRSNPYQPREVFDDDKLDELAASIKEHGVFTPILVRESLNGFELVAGERRVKASKKVGLETIPTIIVSFNDTEMMEIALLENIQRENLSAIEEANAYSQMIDNLGYTQAKVAERVGKSRAHVANLLRLLNLPKPVQDLIVEQKVTMGQVRPLLSESDEDVIKAYAQLIQQQNMSARNVERLVNVLSKIDKKIKVRVLTTLKDYDSVKISKIKSILDIMTIKQSGEISEVILDYKAKDILAMFDALVGKNAQQIDKYIKTGEETTRIQPRKESDPHLKDLESKLATRLSTRVKISKNDISIKFSDIKDLNRILALLDLIED